MKQRAFIIISLLAIIVALPLVLRRESATTAPNSADDRLVILSPHNESIRSEFGEAFARYWKNTTNRTIYVDWRTPGGTSEIRMVLDAGFKAAEETGRQGIGVDLFFGGGQPDFSGQARKDRLVPLRVFQSQPDLFGENGQIPQSFTGEQYYPDDHVWVGTCISQFGICYNPDFIQRLGLDPPAAWQDLGSPGYAGTLALADPTKSGSVARTFELIVQAEILKALKTDPHNRQSALDAGWTAGLQLIQRMAANARYFTDSASKIPHDVGQGNAAAGMCIDFYGRSYAHDLTTPSGDPRVVWIAPTGGTTLSADPIGVLKGAPHPEIAQAFVEFCLTREAQQLWFAKPGTPNGPAERALHRTPIRRDLYSPEILANTTMPGNAVYQNNANYTYQPELTSKSFSTLRMLVKAMCIDSHDEMKSAWAALKAAGMPADALAVFNDVSIMPYSKGGHGDPGFNRNDPLGSARYSAELGKWFRANYRKAEQMARTSTP
ncbi:MAG: ABC transporter substrate-binding protein [Verrucomicrobiales bacterium]|nr:extracellular solute-binding protein [Verrucomicrobiota bacterium JB025]